MIDVRLTLISASPRREELLRKMGVPFDICPTRAAEHWTPENAEALTVKNARRKVERSPHFGDRSRLLLGADTLIQIERRLLGKPAGPESARRMLQLLVGKTHDVITGVCLAGPNDDADETLLHVASATTRVAFYPLTAEQIQDYLDCGEWRDKAGAYAIQGLARNFVARMDCDLDNVVGLPVQLIHDILHGKFIHCRLC